MADAKEGKTHLGVVIVGHVDAGKSTTTGRLLFELGKLDARALEKLQAEADAVGKGSFVFAFFMDKTDEERNRGVTIACTTKEFFTANYHYTIIDAPGHKDFIKNMVSGASQADVALLMVPAKVGGFEAAIQKGTKNTVKGQTRHHAELTNLLGISQIMVGVNKMDDDSVLYKEARYKEVESEMRRMLKGAGWKNFKDCPVIPISGWQGDNITGEKSKKMDWWKGFSSKVDKKTITGFTLYDALNDYVQPPVRRVDNEKTPFRMPVSAVYKIGGVGDVITGRIEQGTLVPNVTTKKGVVATEVHFHPSNTFGKVSTIELHHKSVPTAVHGDNVGVQVKGLSKAANDRPRAGDVMVIKGDKTIGKISKFTCRVKVQEHPGEMKVGFTPIAFVRTANAACRMSKIHWKLTKAALKKGKPKNAAESEALREVDPLFIKKGDMCELDFEPLPKVPLCADTFKQCPGLARLCIMESKNLIMLGRIESVVISEYK